MEIRVDYLLNALPIMGIGMLGIFVVTGVIITVVALLNKLTSGKKDKEKRAPRLYKPGLLCNCIKRRIPAGIPNNTPALPHSSGRGLHPERSPAFCGWGKLHRVPCS